MMALTSILNPLEDKSLSTLISPVEAESPSSQVSLPPMLASCVTTTVSSNGNMDIATNKRPKLSRSWSSRSQPLSIVTSQRSTLSKGDLDVKYLPCELVTEEVRRKHIHFKLSPPLQEIRSSRRRIPYASDKKDFYQKTRREAFETFSYDFNKPGDSKTYTILWDYETGLVRTTAIFKACGFQKTTPAKMLQSNPGLKELCYSITGGALAAQGYWIPFAAARAVSATFAYEIREILTPVFGLDFVDQCIPKSSMEWANMQVSQSIIKQCALDAQKMFEAEVAASKKRARVEEEMEWQSSQQLREEYEERGEQQTASNSHVRSAYDPEILASTSYAPLALPVPRNTVQYRSGPPITIPSNRLTRKPSSSSTPSFSSSLRYHQQPYLQGQPPFPSSTSTTAPLQTRPRARPTLPSLTVITGANKHASQEKEKEVAARIAVHKDSPSYPLSARTTATPTPTPLVLSASSSRSVYSSGSSYAPSHGTALTIHEYDAENGKEGPSMQLQPFAISTISITPTDIPQLMVATPAVQNTVATPSNGQFNLQLAESLLDSQSTKANDEDSREALIAAAILMQGVKEDMARREEQRLQQAHRP